MKIMHIERLIDVGGFSATEEWKMIEGHITQAIKAIQWPPGSGSFTLYAQPGKARGESRRPKNEKEVLPN